MKNKLLLFFILGAAIGGNLFVLSASPAAAQTQTNANEYTVLAPLPGTTLKENCVAGDKDCKTTLKKYLPGVFNLAIGLSAAFAVLMIVFGGFQYMSTDALQDKEEGRTRISNAVKGLVLVIAAYLILYTINPALLTLRLQIDPVSLPTPASSNNGSLGTGSRCLECTNMNQSQLTLSPSLVNWCQSAIGGCSINQTLLGKLQNLNSQTSGLVITEVWPPTRPHQNQCHQIGTCVDARIGNISDATSIKASIDAATASGLKPVFETSDQNLVNQLRQAGVPSTNVLYLPQCTSQLNSNCITGPHFSLYNN